MRKEDLIVRISLIPYGEDCKGEIDHIDSIVPFFLQNVDDSFFTLLINSADLLIRRNKGVIDGMNQNFPLEVQPVVRKYHKKASNLK